MSQRSYWYVRDTVFVVGYDATARRYARGEYEYEGSNAEVADVVCDDPTTYGCSSYKRTSLDLPLVRRNWIDAEYTDESIIPKVCDRSERD